MKTPRRDAEITVRLLRSDGAHYNFDVRYPTQPPIQMAQMAMSSQNHVFTLNSSLEISTAQSPNRASAVETSLSKYNNLDINITFFCQTNLFFIKNIS